MSEVIECPNCSEPNAPHAFDEAGKPICECDCGTVYKDEHRSMREIAKAFGWVNSKEHSEGTAFCDGYEKGAESRQAEVDILRSKQSQHESTVLATVKARDAAEAKLKTAVEALEFYAKPFNVMGYEVTIYHEAREALRKIGETHE